MGLSNFSLERLNFPTQVLFRSSKLIPVMIGNYVFLKRKYSLKEVLAVLLIVVGLIGISMSDTLAKNKFDFVGLVAVVLSLVFDAFASNLEEKAFSGYGAPKNEVIAMIYLLGSLEIGFVALCTSQIKNGYQHCQEEPMLMFFIILFSYLGAVGIQFVYTLIQTFGSLIAVMVTSLRKAFTVCLSFILYPDKVFTIFHLLSIVLIAMGIGLNVYSKHLKEAKSEEKALKSNPSPLLENSEDNE